MSLSKILSDNMEDNSEFFFFYIESQFLADKYEKGDINLEGWILDGYKLTWKILEQLQRVTKWWNDDPFSGEKNTGWENLAQ